MADFAQYQHVERFGNREVLGIEKGTTYIFPKIDGTNASVWYNPDCVVGTGSRKRVLSIGSDNQGFTEYAFQHEGIKNHIRLNPTLRLFGEWLVPHILKTYREDAWRKFYVFDVAVDTPEGLQYLPYNGYKEILETYNIDYIPCIAEVKDGNYDTYVKLLEKNTFLIEDGKGIGEGIVIKNYDYYNEFGKQVWAKLVTNDFKTKNNKEMGAPLIGSTSMLEEKIVDKYCTEALVEKNYAKITNQTPGNTWSSKDIPKLFGMVFYDLIQEESWNFIKFFKSPTIDYQTLYHFVINKIKEVKKELF